MPDRPIDPSLLPTFLDVLRHRGIGAAARATHMSQPAVTARIRRLEDTLGVPLLLRSRTGITPTAAGERLADYARAVQRLLDEEFKPKKLAHKPAPVSYVGDEVPQAAESWERADALFCALE